MEWLKTILPLIGVALGWLLSESGKKFADKRQDKRKLKKLLFFLLELRYHFAKELSMEIDLDKHIVTLKNRMADKLGVNKDDTEFNIGIDAWKPILEQIILKTKNEDNRFEYLAKNIDKVITDLAEVFPILAYELSGQHNIKERLNKVDNYFTEIKSITDKVPFDIKKWINPKLTKELLNDLDTSIGKIAEKIDKRTMHTSKRKIAKMTFEDDNVEILIDEYLDKVIENLK